MSQPLQFLGPSPANPLYGHCPADVQWTGGTPPYSLNVDAFYLNGTSRFEYHAVINTIETSFTFISPWAPLPNVPSGAYFTLFDARGYIPQQNYPIFLPTNAYDLAANRPNLSNLMPIAVAPPNMNCSLPSMGNGIITVTSPTTHNQTRLFQGCPYRFSWEGGQPPYAVIAEGMQFPITAQQYSTSVTWNVSLPPEVRTTNFTLVDVRGSNAVEVQGGTYPIRIPSDGNSIFVSPYPGDGKCPPLSGNATVSIPPPTSSASSAGGPEVGGIVGGVVGGVAAIAALLLAFFLWRRRRRSHERVVLEPPDAYDVYDQPHMEEGGARPPVHESSEPLSAAFASLPSGHATPVSAALYSPQPGQATYDRTASLHSLQPGQATPVSASVASPQSGQATHDLAASLYSPQPGQATHDLASSLYSPQSGQAAPLPAAVSSPPPGQATQDRTASLYSLQPGQAAHLSAAVSSPVDVNPMRVSSGPLPSPEQTNRPSSVNHFYVVGGPSAGQSSYAESSSASLQHPTTQGQPSPGASMPGKAGEEGEEVVIEEAPPAYSL